MATLEDIRKNAEDLNPVNDKGITRIIQNWGNELIKQIQKWLNTQGFKVAVDGKIGNQTIGAINDLIEVKGEKIAFESLEAHRRHFLSRLRDFDVFGRGWYNRLNDFVAYAYQTINGNS